MTDKLITVANVQVIARDVEFLLIIATALENKKINDFLECTKNEN